jgi:hypothetical protein
MFKPLPLLLLGAVFFWGCGRSPAPEAKADDQKFTFESVKYTEDGKTKTSKFEDGTLAIRADAVKNEITIQGSYGPGESTVTTLVVGDFSVTPTFKDGKWTATIDANKMKINTVYPLKAKSKESEIATAEIHIAAQ